MDQSSDENIKEWVQTFFNASSPDKAIQKKAENIITQKMNSDTPNLIIICTKILTINSSGDATINNAKSLASILLTQMLNFHSPSELDFKRKNLNPEIIEQIKNALNQNILSTVPTIQNKVAQCYSILFAILTINWPQGIENIINSFSNMNLLPNGFIGLISIMREIVNQGNFQTEIISNFQVFFTQTFIFCLDILSKGLNETGYTAELRIKACEYIRDIISVHPQILNGEQIGEKIPFILSKIPSSFQISNITLFSNLVQLLYLLVRKFYPISLNFMETVANYVGNGFPLNSTCACICIFFWKNVAMFEADVIEDFEMSKKSLQRKCEITPLNPLLCEIAMPSLLPILINFMESISENNISVDTANYDQDPSAYSMTAIYDFYKVIPDKVFNFLIKKIEEDLKSEKWTKIHAGVQMICAISGKPVKEEVGHFISSHFNTLLHIIKNDSIPRLKETSLYAIALIIKNYPEIITEAGEYTDFRIKEVIEVIEPSLKMDEEQKTNNLSFDMRQIFIRYAQLMYNLSSCWKDRFLESHIGFFFDKFYEFNSILFNYGITNNDQMMIQESSESLDSLILNSIPPIFNKIDWLFAKTLDMLVKSMSFHCSEEIKFMIQSSLCSNIRSILIKLRRNPTKGKEIIGKYANQTLEIMFQLLGFKNVLIYEEALNAISALIIATNIKDSYFELFNEESFNMLIKVFIYRSLLSENENVINAGCSTITNLFEKFSQRVPALNSFIPDIFNTLSNLIMQGKQKRNIHYFVLAAIASIFNNLVLEARDASIFQLEIPLRELLNGICNVSSELDLTKEDNVVYGNMFYLHLTETYGGYARVFYNPTDACIEKKQLLMLNNLAKAILNLAPKISLDVFTAFMQTALKFAQNCSTKNNSVLNRNNIHNVFKLAIEYLKINNNNNNSKIREFEEAQQQLRKK